MMVATLVLSFRSFRMAGVNGVIAVLSPGPGLGALWCFGFPFVFMAIIGAMGLVGVAINDSIVVLAAIRKNKVARTGDHAAVLDVVMQATRHVVATTLTTIAGFIPLLMDGGGFWPPLAITVAGGVGGSNSPGIVFCSICLHSGHVPRQVHRRRSSRTISQQPSCFEPFALVFRANESSR